MYCDDLLLVVLRAVLLPEEEALLFDVLDFKLFTVVFLFFVAATYSQVPSVLSNTLLPDCVVAYSWADRFTLKQIKSSNSKILFIILPYNDGLTRLIFRDKALGL